MFVMNLTLKQFQEKRGKYLSILLTGDDRILSASRKFSKNIIEKFPNHKRKYNVSPISWHEVNTKNIEYLMVDNKQELW